MQRHLASWGITFEDLLDQYRRHMALEYLQSGRQSIAAFRLVLQLGSGHRAFRPWTGQLPRQAMKDLSAVRERPPAPSLTPPRRERASHQQASGIGVSSSGGEVTVDDSVPVADVEGSVDTWQWPCHLPLARTTRVRCGFAAAHR
jgi:hypothetical protein